jgi:hypothetical protein
MSSENPRTAVNEFILDCSEVSSRLDAVSTHDHRTAIAHVLGQARNDYKRLLFTRDMLFMTRTEASIIEIMLDRLLARLKFLEKRA